MKNNNKETNMKIIPVNPVVTSDISVRIIFPVILAPEITTTASPIIPKSEAVLICIL